MSDWPNRTLEELCVRVTVGHVGSMAHEYVESGVPFLRSQNIKRGRLDLSSVKYINKNFHQRLVKSQLQPGDLVIVRTGEPGATALIPNDLGPANCSDIVIARPGPGTVARYLCYAINATAQQFIDAHTVGAVQQHFNVASAKRLTVTVPPIAIQEAIASLLGALDDKIAVNDRIVSTADALRSSLLQDAQNQRPDDFVAQPLSQIAEFINGRAFTKDATGSGRMVVRIAEINSGPGPSTVYNDIAVNEKHLVRPGDVLFSWSGSLAVTRWFRPEAIINQHIFKVIPHGDTPKWIAFEAVKSKLADYRAIAADKATTMGHIQRRHLDEEIVMPIPEVINRLDRQAGSLWQRALVAEQESLTLAALRDSLLPELMSGRLRLRDAEKVVEEAV